MSEKYSEYKLLSYENNYDKLIPKMGAYYITHDKLDNIKWNTINLAKWSLGIHYMQHGMSNKFDLYFSDLYASVKNYFE